MSASGCLQFGFIVVMAIVELDDDVQRLVTVRIDSGGTINQTMFSGAHAGGMCHDLPAVNPRRYVAHSRLKEYCLLA